MDGGVRDRRGVDGRDFLTDNKADAVEWGKQRRAKAEAAAQKRRERKLREEEAIKAQEEYDRQIEQYKDRGYVPSSAFETNDAVCADVPSETARRAVPRSQHHPPDTRRRKQRDGPFGRAWNSDFATGESSDAAWQPLAANLLDETPPTREDRRQSSRGKGAGRQGGRSTVDEVLGRKAAEKLADQQRHEDALERARVQAAAERRMMADRQRQRDSGSTGQLGHVRHADPGSEATQQPTPAQPSAAASRDSRTPPQDRSANVSAADTALLSADPNSLGWQAFQRLMELEENGQALEHSGSASQVVSGRSAGAEPVVDSRPSQRPAGPPGCAPPLWGRSPSDVARDRFGSLSDDGRDEPAIFGAGGGWSPPPVITSPGRGKKSPGRGFKSVSKARRATIHASDAKVRPAKTATVRMLASKPVGAASRKATRAAGSGSIASDPEVATAFSDAEGSSGSGEPRLQQAPQRKLRLSTTPGKAALAAEAIAKKRDARRAAAREEKARRESEVAEHGDSMHFLCRRKVQEFRAALESGSLQLPWDTRAVDAAAAAAEKSSLLVCVRKRPLLPREQNGKNSYDVLTVTGTRTLTCHEPRTKMDMTQTLEHQHFLFDHVFSEHHSTADVYRSAVAPSLYAALDDILLAPRDQPAADAGGHARISGQRAGKRRQRGSLTVFAYGQTGSGKTFTMEPIYAQTVAEALQACDDGSAHLSVSFFEIYCSKVYDLLQGRLEVRTLEDQHGEVQVAGLAEAPVHDLDSALSLIELGQHARVTHANAVHDDSSRSHAVLQLVLRDGEATGPLLGKLVLVDLAGSEKASETLSDDKATRHEGAEINKSLLALKECIRALGRGDKHKQFRGSKLTQILKTGLSGGNSRAVMIAALSPASACAGHTINTLRYADRLKEISARAKNRA